MTNLYKKDVSDLSYIDIYRIADLYDISDHRQFHAMKKTICAGKRGSKSAKQDMIEAIESILNWLENNHADEKICMNIYRQLQGLKSASGYKAGGLDLPQDTTGRI